MQPCFAVGQQAGMKVSSIYANLNNGARSRKPDKFYATPKTNRREVYISRARAAAAPDVHVCNGQSFLRLRCAGGLALSKRLPRPPRSSRTLRGGSTPLACAQQCAALRPSLGYRGLVAISMAPSREGAVYLSLYLLSRKTDAAEGQQYLWSSSPVSDEHIVTPTTARQEDAPPDHLSVTAAVYPDLIVSDQSRQERTLYQRSAPSTFKGKAGSRGPRSI